jgi:dienelactone hydrolase
MLQLALARMDVEIPVGDTTLGACVARPPDGRGTIVIALRSAEGRHGGVNRRIAQLLNARGFATVLIDLLTDEEQWIDDAHPGRRFSAERLADRLGNATRWIAGHPATRGLAIAYLARGAAAPIAMRAATQLPDLARVVVVRARVPLGDDASSPTTLVRHDDGAPETLDGIAETTADWFQRHLAVPPRPELQALRTPVGNPASG